MRRQLRGMDGFVWYRRGVVDLTDAGAAARVRLVAVPPGGRTDVRADEELVQRAFSPSSGWPRRGASIRRGKVGDVGRP
eukprot:scaffold3551_cov408-Prasinococcus_capsulatus_cf.AAC.24